MKFLRSVILASSLLVSAAYADGAGIYLGPFSLEFGVNDYGPGRDRDYETFQRSTLDTPICTAISNLKQLAITVEVADTVSKTEKKITTKSFVVEPYAYGTTMSGKPVLRGNVVSEKVIKEETLKYGDEHFDDSKSTAKKEDNSYFFGMFSSSKDVNIDIRRVIDIQVINDSHFDAPKNYKGIEDKDVQINCQVPVNQ